MTSAAALIAVLRDVSGRGDVLTSQRATLPYRQAFRSGVGEAVAVVRPRSLVALWRVVQACVAADAVIVMQAANTGLTGGSTPDPDTPGPVVIISTTRLDTIHLLDGGRQVVCLAGATLNRLEKRLRPLGREPHSVIGSSCFGASVVGGVCNNSGGSLIRRGPAYTELAVFARLSEAGVLTLVNNIGIPLGEDPEQMLERLAAGAFEAAPAPPAAASDPGYETHVRDVEAPTPARFNADPRRLHDASGSAGRLIVFAVRLDTFAADRGVATFYVGTDSPRNLTLLRLRMLQGAAPLPISAEYLHRDTFDVAERYGRDTFLAIRLLGTDRLPMLYAVKARVDAFGRRLGLPDVADRILQCLGELAPRHLSRRLYAWRDRFEHHLILKVTREAAEDTGARLDSLFGDGAFRCSEKEADDAFLHRFVAAGAAVRYLTVHRRALAGLVALDFALPRNARDWFGPVPEVLTPSIEVTLRYGHFFCHVFHHDHLVARGHNPAVVKAGLLEALESEGAEYPAEHNVGRQYRAKPALAAFYRRLDPLNRFNPGIGMTPTGPGWGAAPVKGDTP